MPGFSSGFCLLASFKFVFVSGVCSRLKHQKRNLKGGNREKDTVIVSCPLDSKSSVLCPALGLFAGGGGEAVPVKCPLGIRAILSLHVQPVYSTMLGAGWALAACWSCFRAVTALKVSSAASTSALSMVGSSVNGLTLSHKSKSMQSPVLLQGMNLRLVGARR